MSAPVLIIAEAGVNHDGKLEQAQALVDVAAEAGADAVKFQTFAADRLAGPGAAKADYQKRSGTAGESQREMLRRLELSPQDHRNLLEHCRERGIAFLSTPFDPESLAFLVDELALPGLKLGSGEVTNAPLLVAAGHSGCDIILSTGMSSLGEVEQALAALAYGMLYEGPPADRAQLLASLEHADAWPVLRRRVILLHCTTDYPAAPADANLRAMDSLRAAFGLPIGYSDHTTGTVVAMAAVARGARVIEKHFTLDRGLPGPDHAASLEPGDLAALVTGIRTVEEALGDGIKQARPAERTNRPVARKAPAAACAIAAGETFTTDNLTVLRTGAGRSPFDYWDALGRRAARAFDPGEPVEW